MKKRPDRRDFLKLAGILPVSLMAPRALQHLNAPPLLQSGQDRNVIVVVLDAFSAYHIALHGYRRETTPNLARLAEQAIVYHNHHAGANFTTPGTASLLTGTLPWTHRALQPNGTVIEPFVTRNIFSAFKNHYRIAYTHNPWANKLLEQFSSEMEELVPWLSLFLRSYDELIHTVFKNDDDIASVSWTRNVKISEGGYAYSLFFSHLYESLQERNIASLRESFPLGIPSIGTADISFLLEQAVNWIGDRLALIPQPFLGYFHFMPPHGPYRTSRKYYNHFRDDGFTPMEKPEDVFTEGKSFPDLVKRRIAYDEFILYADEQFNIFFEQLRASGLLENTWVILTSDHGEMFERGIDGHSNDALYQPVIRIPLMIFEPGRTSRLDIHAPTSAIDVLPTLLHITGQDIPSWAEGTVLPPFALTGPDPNRNLFVVRANKIDHFAPISRASLTLTQGNYKLHYYIGYQERDVPELIRLFDIEADPQEMVDLSGSQRGITARLLDELLAKLTEVNKPYL